MKKLTEIDPEKMKLNPYSFTLSIDAVRFTDPHKFINNEGVFQANSYLMEQMNCTRLFHTPGLKELLGNLSPGAKSLFLYILADLDNNEDYFRINAKQYMKINRVRSINTYYSAIKELSRYCFITASVDYKDVYFINPSLFFAGNRMRKFPENIKIKGELEKQK